MVDYNLECDRDNIKNSDEITGEKTQESLLEMNWSCVSWEKTTKITFLRLVKRSNETHFDILTIWGFWYSITQEVIS